MSTTNSQFSQTNFSWHLPKSCINLDRILRAGSFFPSHIISICRFKEVDIYCYISSTVKSDWFYNFQVQIILLELKCTACSSASHLCIFVAVSSRVFQVLAGAFVTVGVQVNRAGRSLCQELCPDVLCPLCNFVLRYPL